jgi:hypothetical protein
MPLHDEREPAYRQYDADLREQSDCVMLSARRFI